MEGKWGLDFKMVLTKTLGDKSSRKSTAPLREIGRLLRDAPPYLIRPVDFKGCWQRLAFRDMSDLRPLLMEGKKGLRSKCVIENPR